MTDIVRIPFNGDEILAAEIDGKPHVILKPAFDAIGLASDKQINKLRSQPWATTAVTEVVAADGKARQMVTADIRTFLMALATIPASRVAEAVRPKLVAYQAEVADAIEAYWTKGGAINSRATEDQLADLIGRAEGQARVLQSLRGLVDGAWLEAKARHVAARALGEEPEVDPAARPLTVGEYLQDKGVKGSELRSLSTKLGVRVKGLFIGAHGRDPQKVDRFVDGALRSVYGYTEADRPLFDQAWKALRAPAH
jgi:hypothetical protein